MEARQRVKLSLTNRSSGLIPTEPSGRHAQRQGRRRRSIEDMHHLRPRSLELILDSPAPLRLADLVVIARGPHPIPSRTRP